MATNEFLRKYLSADESEAAIQEAKDDLGLLEQVLNLEIALNNAKKQNLLLGGDKTRLSLEQIYELAEAFTRASESGSLKELDIENKNWKTLWQNKTDFAFFKEIIQSLQAKQEEIKTPEYLLTIARRRLQAENTARDEQTILIRIKEGLQLIGGYLDNVFALPEQNEAFAIRSTMAMQAGVSNTPGMLQFFTAESENEKILYQVVKDSSETVMLTVKLQGFRPLPKTMKLLRDGRLMHSFQVKEDFAYFPQLMPGEYAIELIDRHGKSMKSIHVSLLSD